MLYFGLNNELRIEVEREAEAEEERGGGQNYAAEQKYDSLLRILNFVE